jgi:eukaryotic-like serine/threonine-protein kinase
VNDLISFFKSQRFWKHFAYALGGIVGGVFLILLLLRLYTHHGQALSVPVFVGLTLQEAQTVAEDKSLRLEIIDSVYMPAKPRGTIVAQTPSPDSKVKVKRIIFITLNAVNPEKTEMPNVLGFSLRQAQDNIENRGLKVGNISYVPDIAQNYVLKQLYRNRDILPNSKINKGSLIDLVVGMGVSNEQSSIPNIVGLSLDNARETLSRSYLNVGAIVYDNSVETYDDSTKAVVWKQSPGYVSGRTISLGSPIDVFLTIDQAKISNADTTSTY